MNLDANAVAFEGVSKDYLLGGILDVLRACRGRPTRGDRVKALQDLSFRVPRGKLLGVLGRNGAGKSTLLRVAGGIYLPDLGTVQVASAPASLFELGIGGSKHHNGRQFCDSYFRLRGVAEGELDALAQDVQEFSELGDFFHRPLRTYSSGMRSRLFFGAATALPARIVLLDELLCVGDESFQGKSYRRLIQMIDGGTSGVLVSHDWFRTMRLCDEVLILDHGSAEYQGPALDAVRRYLDQDIPLSRRARFVDPEALVAAPRSFRTGEPVTIEFEYEVDEDVPVQVGYALEAPRSGVVLALENTRVFSTEAGRYRLRLTIPGFPVALPECFLSLFLSAPPEEGSTQSAEVFDQLSWTTGDSIRLENADQAVGTDAPLLAPALAWDIQGRQEEGS